MFSSQPISRDIGSEFFPTQNPSQQAAATQQASGLARYRSAPSSFLATLLDTDLNTNISSGDDESEAIMFSTYMDRAFDPTQMHFSTKQESGLVRSGNGHMDFESAVVGSYSLGMETSTAAVQVRGRNGNCSALLRQSSSPAGFLNGFSVMGEGGNYKVQNHPEAGSSGGGLSNHMKFSSGTSSSSRFMPSIPESENESAGSENDQTRNGSGDIARDFDAGAFPHDSWNESSFSSLKRNREGDLKMFSGFSKSENQTGEARKSPLGLVHHLSLPKTSSEMATVEKYLQFQPETVPCQVRAKRGFATHPRSIAERVRRTKISEKMKKLQDLFPTIDKQTSTSDMLDMAVEYIKDLQKQVQTLSDTREKCICSSKS